MSDTTAVSVTQQAPRVAGSGRSSGLAAVATLLLLVALPGLTPAEPAALDARVVWVRGDRAYIAARDSLSLLPFSRLTFTLKSKPVATAEVERAVDGGMVVARVTSGSLAGVKHLDRLRVAAEAPDRSLRLEQIKVRLRRVGYPSPKRAHLLFACDSLAIGFKHPYRLEGAGPHLRLVDAMEFGKMTARPETIVVRMFDDAADQEIALERGELDVAVFWPGELSTHMRNHPRWKNRLAWPLERSLIATISETGSTETRCAIALRAAGSLRALAQDAFRGDLRVSKGLPSCGDSIPSVPAAVLYKVDPSCPGQATLERFLNRDAPRGPEARSATVLPLSWQDPRTFSSNEVVTATALCQVVFASESDADDFFAGFYVTLFQCLPRERRP